MSSSTDAGDTPEKDRSVSSTEVPLINDSRNLPRGSYRNHAHGSGRLNGSITAQDIYGNIYDTSDTLLGARTLTGMVNGEKHSEIEEDVLYHGSKQFTKPSRRKSSIICCVIGIVTFVLGIVAIGICTYMVLFQCNCQSNVVDDSTQSSQQIGSNSTELVNSVNTTSTTETTTVPTTPIIYPSTTTKEPIVITNSSQAHLVNLAQGKEAKQSSTFETEEGLRWEPSLAVDGINSTLTSSRSCSQTRYEKEPYWYVDLGSLVVVKRVKIVLATDCCFSEMQNFEVRIGQQKDLSLNALCRYYMGTAIKKSISIICDRPMYGQYVSIKLFGDEEKETHRLTLCEVNVYKN